MRKYIALLTGLILFSCSVFGQSHGLQFSSHEVVPEKRTSLNLTSSAPLCSINGTEISFDFSFAPNFETYFGYIIRVITSGNQNIDIVYNQKLLNFNFVIGENFSYVFTIDSIQLFSKWNRCQIRFEEATQEVHFYLNNRFICKGKLNFTPATCCRIYFGANDFEGFKTIDIPPMRIRDIRIRAGNKLKYSYPLTESAGNQCTDAVEKRVALVRNPIWIKPRHQKWENLYSFSTAASASIAFDKKQEVLYIVSADSLYKVSFKNGQLTGTRLSRPHSNLPAGNQSVFDPKEGKLYNLYIDERKVSTYDSGTRSWDVNFSSNTLTEFWQANKFVSSYDSALYVLGGYGQLQYKNLVQRYSFAEKKWEVSQPGGDFFMPRYLAALGVNASSDTAYIMGGYGSKTGDQTINPKYNYELLAFSVRSRSFKSLYQFKEPGTKFCFANSLVIDSATKDFYALIYPIDRFNSSLQLIKGSLQNPEYELVADSIPYAFHDIESFADLYYCPASKKLVAITLFTTKDHITTVKIFTLDFPPNPVIYPAPPAVAQPGNWVYLVLGAIGAAVAGFIFLKRGVKNKTRLEGKPSEPLLQETSIINPVPVYQEPILQGSVQKPNEAAAVFLFGQFEVTDKNGTDITRQFTPLVKELFLLILIYSIKDGRGISSEQLYETLWSDKSIKDARNNYSVNIVKLKTVLEKAGEVHIGKESGKWKLEVLNESIKVDYQQFVALMVEKPVYDKQYITELYNFTQRGSLLKEAQYSWLDDIKSDVSNFVIDAILKYISTASLQAEAEFIVKLTNHIFHFDQLNEEALEFKCRCLVLLGRHGMAKDAYLKFAKEYKENYGQDFERSFTDMAGHS